MKKMWQLMVVLLVLLAFSVGVQAKKPAEDPVPNPNPGQNEFSATPNLSFPMIATEIIDIFYQKVWVEDDGDGLVKDSEWVVGYDSTGDGGIDNVLGNGVPVPIAVSDDINDDYTGDYPGNEGFIYQTYVVGEDGKTVDLNTLISSEDTNGDGYFECTYEAIPDGSPDLTCPVDMETWFRSMLPWRDQPVVMDNTLTENVTAFNDPDLTVTISSAENPNNIWNIEFLDGSEIGGENSWQADWRLHDPELGKIYIDFVDWGNPLENTVAPIVGQRFPVEMAIYEKVASTVTDEEFGEAMTAYQMGCIEYPSSRDEVFGTSMITTGSFTTPICFATVLTKKYFAEVWDPGGGITSIPIEPGIGPSGKINFASAGGGWIPTMTGWHRIWMHFNDPLVSLEGAIVNNDEHYIMSSGYMAEELGKNKQELVGIVGDSTFVDVYVYPANGGGGKPMKK